jgi:hypothetical protein
MGLDHRTQWAKIRFSKSLEMLKEDKAVLLAVTDETEALYPPLEET